MRRAATTSTTDDFLGHLEELYGAAKRHDGGGDPNRLVLNFLRHETTGTARHPMPASTWGISPAGPAT